MYERKLYYRHYSHYYTRIYLHIIIDWSDWKKARQLLSYKNQNCFYCHQSLLAI